MRAKVCVDNVTPAEAEWDPRSFIRDGCRGQTWNNVARWTRAALDRARWQDVGYINPRLAE